MATTPPLNVPSFRIAFGTQLEDQTLGVQQAHKTQWNAITDIYQSIGALNTKVENVKSSSAATAASVENVTNNSETIIQQVANVIGFVNSQIGITAYTTLPSDYGTEIELNDSSPIAVTLSTLSSGGGIQLPWFTWINNLGTGTATLTPASGTINGGASLAVLGGFLALVWYDGTNFSAAISSPDGGVAQIIAGTGIGVSPGSGTGNVTVSLITPVSVADGGTGTATPGLVAGTGIGISGSFPDQTVAIAATAVTPGSYTNTNLTVNAEGQITAAANGSGPGSFNCIRTDKTGTYLSGVTYTNTSGGAVYEEVEMLASGTGTGADSYLAYTVAGVSYSGNGVWNQCSGHSQTGFWVPAGATFSATATYIDGGVTPTINKWTEVSF